MITHMSTCPFYALTGPDYSEVNGDLSEHSQGQDTTRNLLTLARFNLNL